MNGNSLTLYLAKLLLLLCSFIFISTIAIVLNNNSHRIKPQVLNLTRNIETTVPPKDEISSKLVLSYSLFGANSWTLFGENVINVAKEAHESKLYKSWTVRIYHDNFPIDLQKNLSTQYKNLNFIDVRVLENLELGLINKAIYTLANINGMTWRFIPMGDVNVDIMCSRDLDSEIYKREEDAVEYWMKSGKLMHVMRDNKEHGIEILGGTWCFRSSKDRTKGQQILKSLLDNAERRSQTHKAAKGNDQKILVNHMWPQVKHDVIQHDSHTCMDFPGSEPFPSKRTKGYFIGCVRSFCETPVECPAVCRPKDHQDWTFC